MSRHKPLLSQQEFIQRVAKSMGVALLLTAINITVGAIGLRLLEAQQWIDAIVNSVMIMTGLGLITNVVTFEGKFFISIYAFISALVFYIVLGLILSPLVHRFLHQFHLDIEKD